ncbi:MAG: hypothetical protein L3K26_20345 [Candidatus Hydrogenedentes bacterium]|nr:hypothetical protein [Candidatus Hydrogenedentota bacterium]
MGTCRIVLLMLALGLPFAAGALILENDSIRIELEPKTFSLRFLGRPGGPNFIDPVYLTERERNIPGLVMPGGIMTDVLPVREERSALRRGPASIVEHREDYLLLLGQKDAATGLRVKKEYMLHRDEARLTYKLSVLSSLKAQRSVSVRVTAQIPWGSVLELPKPEDGGMRLICGAYPGFVAMAEQSGPQYRISLALRTAREHAVLRVPVRRIDVITPFGIWSRHAVLRSAGERDGTNIGLLALVDDRSATCQIALEGRQAGVNVGAPLVFVESWTLKDWMPRPVDRNVPVNADGSESDSS